MRRVSVALLALALLVFVAACGSTRRAATSVADVRVRAPEPRSHGADRSGPSWVHVTVVDGDRGKRVAGAFVRIGRRARVSDRQGVAKILLARRAALVVNV